MRPWLSIPAMSPPFQPSPTTHSGTLFHLRQCSISWILQPLPSDAANTFALHSTLLKHWGGPPHIYASSELFYQLPNLLRVWTPLFPSQEGVVLSKGLWMRLPMVALLAWLPAPCVSSGMLVNLFELLLPHLWKEDHGTHPIASWKE